MSTIRVNLPDGSHKELEAGQNALDLARSLGPRLAKAAMGAEINGELKSLTTPLADGDTVAILTFDTEGGKDVFRHSASHVMASAILRVRPEAKLAIGPPIEDGFYYDIDADPPLTGLLDDRITRLLAVKTAMGTAARQHTTALIAVEHARATGNTAQPPGPATPAPLQHRLAV